MSKETIVNKSETFEDWRLKSNEVSLDLGSVAADDSYSSTSLDTESRLTDQYITKNDLDDGGLYIRDVSLLPNGLEINYSGDRTVDNTDGYIIFKNGVTSALEAFPSGALVAQYANNATSSIPIFTANIVSASNKKILIANATGIEGFNPSLNLYNADQLSKFVLATRIKEIIVESYSHGNVRVYRTRNYQFDGTLNGAGPNKLILSAAAYHAIANNDIVTYTTPQSGGIYGSAGDTTNFYVIKPQNEEGDREIQLSLTPAGGAAVTLTSGTGTQTLTTTRKALPQDMSRNGFHISRHKYYVSHTASSIPVTFLEGEVVYQGTIDNEDFKAVLYTADIPGVLIFKEILEGTYNSSLDLKSVTTTNGAGSTIAASARRIDASDLNNDFTSSKVDYAQMIEFNTPTVAGDDYKVYFGSAVDAVLELQDDVGTVENLQTTNSTDLTVAINELELGIRGTSNNLVAADLGDSTGRPAFTANNIVSALVEHEVDLYGASKSLTDLGTNDKGDFVLSINELETAIRGTNTALVSADLVSTSSPSAHPAMTATNLIDAVLEHEVDLYGTGSQTLGSLATNNQSNFVAAINELETAIRGTNAGLVLTDLGVTLASYSNSAVNLVDHNEELQRDIGDVTNAKLGLLNTPNVTLATHSSQIASGTNVLTMVSNPIVAGIKVGMFVTSQHSPNSIDTTTGGGSFVTAVSATQVTLSRATTGALTSAALIFKVEDIVTKIKDLDDVLGDIALINNDTFYSDITFTDTTVKDSINSITDYIGGTDIGSVINSGSETLTNAIAQLYTDIGEVGTSGASIVASNYNVNTTDLKKAVIAAAVGMTGSVEFDTAFHASNAGSLAEKSGYSATDLHAAIRELQTYVGDASTLSTSGTTHTETAASVMDGTSTTTLLISPGEQVVDVGYQVAMAPGFTAAQIPANTVVVRVNNDEHTSFTLNNAVTVDSSGDTNNLLFTEPNGYGFADDVVTNALIELRTALVGGTADLTDKINTLDDSDGAGTDFSSTNVVDAIRELQDDLGQRTLITGSPFHSGINGTYNTTNIVTVLNAITAAIGSHDIGNAVNTGNETLTNAIAQLRTDIGDVGASGANLTTTAGTLGGAINELDAEIGDTSAIATASNYSATTVVTGLTEIQGQIGDVSTINDATGFAGSTVVGGIQEIQTDIGNVTIANMGAQTNRTKTTTVETSGTNITVNNTNGLVAGMTATHANITSGQTIASIPDATTVTLSAAVDSNIASGETIPFKADSLQVKLRALDNNTGNVATIANNTGFAATTIVDGITEIQTDIGNVSAANLGTTSGDIVTAIKEIVDGTGQADVQVGAGASGGAAIARTAENGGFLKKVKSGFGANAQTIVSNLNFDAAGTSDINHKTTFKFGQNTVLDVSLATLITEAANADFKTTARKIVFGSTINDGQGIEISRSNGLSGDAERTIDNAIGNLTIDPSILWVDGEVTARNNATSTVTAVTAGSTSSGAISMTLVNATAVEVGTVITSDTAGLVDGTFVSSKSGDSIGLSVATNGIIASGTVLSFNVHNRNDLAWKVKGFKPTSTPDAANSFYQAPNVDFYNAGRLFGKGTSGVDSTQNGVTVTWDPVTQHFDTTLQTIPGLSAGTTGDTVTVPVITVDTFGRITAVTTANVADALGQFTITGDSGSQTVGVNETVKILGTSNEITTALTESGGINTVTVGLPNDVTIGNDLTVTDRLIVQGTGADETSTFAGNVDVSGDLTVTGSITAGGSSLGFTTTSATVSSKQIILNALAGSEIADIASGTGQALVPSASFVAHRGFKSTVVTGAAGSLTKGLRYRIVSTAASNAISGSEQTALKAISGSSENLSHDEVITAVTTGHSTLATSQTITLREQEVEAKIAWNEGNDQWELYRASATSNGAIIAQGDTFNGTLHTSSLVTAALNTDNENKELSFVDVTNNTSTLQRSSGLLYNPSAKHLKVAEAIGIGLTGVVDGSDSFTPEGMLHIKTNVDAKDALLILEADHDNDNENGTPVIQLIQDGRRVRSAVQMTGNANDGAIGARRNSLLFSTAAENVAGNAYMHFATGGAITVGSTSSNINLTSSSNWVPFVSIFNKTAQGTQGSALSWTGYGNGGLAANRATFPNSTTISLAPNTSIYGANDLDNDSGVNIAQDGSDGGAFLHVNTYIEDTTWQGRTLTFSGTVTGFNVNSRYTGEAFVKYLLKTGQVYNEGATITKNLNASEGDLDENGNFSITLKIPALGDPSVGAATPLPQIGFSIKGVNANGLTAFANGDIDINNMVLNVTAAEDTDFASGNPVITTDPTVRMTITSDTGHVGIATTEPGARLDVHGNFRVEGDQNSSFPITTGDDAEDDDLLHTAVFASNNLSQANSLSTTLNKQLKQAVFVSRPAYSGALSYLDITDVRTVDSNNTLAGSAKRIQSRTSTNKNEQGNRKGFISFPGNSNLVEIGGIHTNVDKVGVSTNSGGPTQIFHNTANATPSSKKLETTATGVEVSNTLYVKQLVGIGNSNPAHPLVVQRDDGCVAQIKAIDTGESQPSMTGTLNIQGYEGRGLGLRLQDSATSLEDSSSREWFVGTPYATNTFAIGYAADGVQSMYADQNKLTITDDGKVGIGTTLPTDLLTLSAPMAATPTYIAIRQTGTNAAGGGGGIIFDTSATDTQAGKYQAKIEGIRAQGGHASNELRFFTTFQTGINATLVTGQSDNPQQRMVIDQQGNVGIGTTSPDQVFYAQTEADIAAGVNRQRYPTLDVAGRVKATHIDTVSINTTGNLLVGTNGSGEIRTRDIRAGGNSAANGNSASIRLHAGESIAYAPGTGTGAQNGEIVYINAEGGVQINSSPSNWLSHNQPEDEDYDNTAPTYDGGWDERHTVTICKPDGTSDFNQIKHTGLTMTSGSAIDQLYTLNFTPPTNNEWTDIGINSTTLATGTYLVQMFINEGDNGVYHEMYSGVMSWYAGSVNDDNTDEIFLHNAGHASQAASDEGNKNWYLRTKRIFHDDVPGDALGYLKLQVRSSYTPPTNANRTYTIKLRRMI
jgi:hypothetical protein